MPRKETERIHGVYFGKNSAVTRLDMQYV